MNSNHPSAGSFGYANWHASLSGMPVRDIYEYPLYADAIPPRLEGGPWIFGPYTLFATGIDEALRFERPSFILRVTMYLGLNDFAPPLDYSASVHDRYTGGAIHDEIAAVLSLSLGIRLKIGRFNRVINDEYPLGLPLDTSQEHLISLPQSVRSRPLLPQMSKKTILAKNVQNIVGFVKILPTHSLDLVKASRLYQEAILIAEIDPSQAWILLVSAIEAISYSRDWSKESPSDPWEIIGKWDTTLRECLERSQPTLEELEVISSKITQNNQSTNKFINFIIKYLPNPPINRPSENWQFPWAKTRKMKESLSCIYGYRSAALHSGKPFPSPMCEGWWMHRKDESIYAEIPVEIAQSGRGGVWIAKDVPMTLYIFEYIVRESLLKWWADMAT